VYYFAYGVELSKSLMGKICPDSNEVSAAKLPEYKLVFACYSKRWKGGVATLKPCFGCKVVGAIYNISDADLEQLDHEKGYPVNYNRKIVSVVDATGREVDAIIHLITWQIREYPPSDRYLSTIEEGYREWGIGRTNKQNE
jgi:hypothetical protein